MKTMSDGNITTLGIFALEYLSVFQKRSFWNISLYNEQENLARLIRRRAL
jgi:hypothetical protein